MDNKKRHTSLPSQSRRVKKGKQSLARLFFLDLARAYSHALSYVWSKRTGKQILARADSVGNIYIYIYINEQTKSLQNIYIYIHTMTDIYTAALVPTKPSSGDDSGFKHSFRAEASLPRAQSAPAIPHDTNRLCRHSMGLSYPRWCN